MKKCHEGTPILGLFVLFLHLSDIAQYGIMAIWFHFTSAHHSLIWWGSQRPLGFILAGITSAPQFYTKAAHGSTSILYQGEPNKPFVVALFFIQGNSIIWTLHFHISPWLCRIEFILKTHKSYQICGTNSLWKSRYIELFFRSFRLYQRDGKMGFKRPWVRYAQSACTRISRSILNFIKLAGF